VEAVIAQQRSSPTEVLFGPAYSGPYRAYKLKATLAHQPDLLVLGTSRVLQFRGRFFKEPERMYNAGSGVAYPWQYREFLDALPADRQPSLLILGLDQWHFTGWYHLDDFERRDTPLLEPPPESLHLLQTNWRTIYDLTLAGRIPPSVVVSPYSRDIGWTAINTRNGFRRDGSYHYQRPPSWEIERERWNPATLKVITPPAGEGGISAARIDLVRDLLRVCFERHVHVVAILPPYSCRFHAWIAGRPEFDHVFQLFDELQPLFARYSFTLRDCADLKALGGSDAETRDFLHGSEKAYLRLLILLAEDDEKLRTRVDLPALKELLAGTRDDFCVWED
jgi:hypothetical protein